jgi:hypothetical protein
MACSDSCYQVLYARVPGSVVLTYFVMAVSILHAVAVVTEFWLLKSQVLSRLHNVAVVLISISLVMVAVKFWTQKFQN